MTKKNVAAGTVSAADQGARDFPDKSWEQKLKVARAKRAKTLSAKRSAKQTVAVTETGALVTGAAAIKALFVFAGSAGLALGVVLGIGILIGWGQVGTGETRNILTFDVGDPVVPAPVVEAREQPNPTEAPKVEVSAPLFASVDLPVLAAAPQEVTHVSLEPKPEDITLFQDRLMNSITANTRSLPIATETPEAFSLEPAVVAKVFIHAPNGVGKSKLQSMSSKVKATGVEVAGIGRESFRVSSTHLRYYSPATEQAATALASDLGVTARDFSQNALVPGRIELWIAGQPRKRVVAKRAPEPKRTLLSWLKRNAEKR